MAGLAGGVFGQPFQGEIDALGNRASQTDVNAIAAVLLQLQTKVQLYEIADASPTNNPSTERLRRRDEIRSALEKVKPQLLELAQSGQQDVQVKAIAILGFARPDETVYQALKNVSSGASLPVVTSAYSTLFQLRLDNDETREELVTKLKDYADPLKSELAFTLINQAGLWNWDLPEALPIYKEILKSSASPTGKVAVANALKRMGGGAADALDELKAALADLERSGENFRYINAFKETIQVVEGKDQPLTAVSTTRASSSDTQAPPPGSASLTPEAKAASSRFPVVPVAILGALIVAVAVFFLRRRGRREG